MDGGDFFVVEVEVLYCVNVVLVDFVSDLVSYCVVLEELVQYYGQLMCQSCCLILCSDCIECELNLFNVCLK